jgi:hypothetical protein
MSPNCTNLPEGVDVLVSLRRVNNDDLLQSSSRSTFGSSILNETGDVSAEQFLSTGKHPPPPAGGQRIGVGDLVISRRNDPTFDLRDPDTNASWVASVRNGNRWRVAAIDAKTNRVAAERLDDQARVVFDADFLREHVNLGYAIAVHSAQGITADTSHAVLSENTRRALLYVAMIRGRHTNAAHLYKRGVDDHEYGHQGPDCTHLMHPGDSGDVIAIVHRILANNDQLAITAHGYAARVQHCVT